MTRTKMYIARFASLLFIASFLVIPKIEALPYPFPGDVYFFVGNENGGRYAVKSNGDGTFESITLTFTKGDNNRGGSTEDFDGDGDVDFVGGDDDFDNFYLFTQGPPGVFTDQGVVVTGFPLNGAEMGAAADDFNVDGNADVLGGSLNNFFRILFGDGAGGFTMSASTNAPAGTFRAKDTGDIDRDGDPDIVATVATGGQAYLFLNDGAGNFSAGTLLFDTLGNSNDPHTVVVADFTSDGYLDILAGGSLDGDVSLWTGDGTGAFTLFGPAFDFNGRTAAGSYDFDGDGNQDVVTITQSDFKVRSLAGNGNGTFQPAVELGSIGSSGVGMATPPVPPIRSTVKGNVWKDFDGDALNDDGGDGFASVLLALSGTDHLGGTVNLTTTTGPTGAYAFERVLNGSYTLSITTAPDAHATTTISRSVSISLENTTVVQDFGYLPYSSVSGSVFNDANGDGIQNDGVGGYSGIAVTLTGTDYQGGAVNLNTTSGVGGAYSFGSLLLSSGAGYTVSSDTPADTSATTPTSQNVVISTGSTSAAADFGFKELPREADVDCLVFNDTDGNGINDDGAGGLENVELQLSGTTEDSASLSLTTTTGVAGTCSFPDVPFGDYTLAVTLPPAGYDATTPESLSFTINSRTTVSKKFGYKESPHTFNLTVLACNDPNGNGLNDDGAPGLEGVEFLLSGTDEVGDPVSIPITTPSGGLATVNDVRFSDAGGYTLAVTLPPAGYTATTAESFTFVATSQGTVAKEVCYKENPRVHTVQGTVFNDTNGDGGNNDGAGGFSAEVTVSGTDENGDPVNLTQLTPASGTFSFEVPFSDGNGFTLAITVPPAGHDPTTPETFNLVLTTQGTTTRDFGYKQTIVCTDADGDGYSTEGGACGAIDCNDTVGAAASATLKVDVTSFSSSGPGADMSDQIFVGDTLTPFGTDLVTIPLTADGAPIVDSASSADVPGLHVQRGVHPSKGPYVTISAFGMNEQTTREVIKAALTLTNATVAKVRNGPNGPYEHQGDGTCIEGKPGQDEYTIALGGTTGTICSTTNTHTDAVTIYYRAATTGACSTITDPSIQCLEQQFASCGICTKPGGEEFPYGDGIDNNCDAVTDCGMKTDYAPKQCSGQSVVVTNDAELDAYLVNYGLQGGKYRGLRIDYSVTRPLIAIHSPCEIKLKKDIVLTASSNGSLCLDGRLGVSDDNGYGIVAGNAAILSQLGDSEMGQGSTFAVSKQMRMEGLGHVKIGVHSTGSADSLTMLSNGTLSQSKAHIRHESLITITGRLLLKAVKDAILGESASVSAGSVHMTAANESKLFPHSSVSASGNFHMQAGTAAKCSVASSATISAGSTSGNCLP